VTNANRKQTSFLAGCIQDGSAEFSTLVTVRRTDPKGQVRSDEGLHEPMARRLSGSAVEKAVEAVQTRVALHVSTLRIVDVDVAQSACGMGCWHTQLSSHHAGL
jgi:hypothetical protein